jgi:hypothetical protein
MKYKSKIVLRVSEQEIDKLRKHQLINVAKGIRKPISQTLRELISKIE